MQQKQEAYAQPLPGERFCPMEDELLCFFLKLMIESGPQHVYGLDDVVFDHDLYGDQEPWEIWDLYKNVRPQDLRLNKDLYFLTKHKKRKKRTKPSQRISRTVGHNGGTWKGNDYGKDVVIVETGVKIGTKKRLTYENKDSEQDGCWIMHEFSLDPSARDNKKPKKTENDDYVLCLLRRNVEAKAKRGHKNERRIRRREEVEEDDNDACNDGEESNRNKQEELHKPQTKRQRNDVTYAWPQEVALPMMPSSRETREDDVMDAVADDSSPPEVVLRMTRPSSETNEDDDGFAAWLEESLEREQHDESSPPNSKDESAMIEFQDHASCQEEAINNNGVIDYYKLYGINVIY